MMGFYQTNNDAFFNSLKSFSISLVSCFRREDVRATEKDKVSQCIKLLPSFRIHNLDFSIKT